MSAVPIVNLPFKYINGLGISNDLVTPNTKLDIDAGQCRDSSNIYDMVSNLPLVLDFTANGLNGIDTGSIAVAAWYYIYLISDPVTSLPIGCIASLSATPLLPFGYSAYRQIGWAQTAGSALLKMYISGNNNYRYLEWDSHIQVIIAGAAVALTDVDLSLAVPPADLLPIILDVEINPAAAGGNIAFATTGSVATLIPSLSGSVMGVPQTGQLKVISKLLAGVPNIQYINSVALSTANVFVNGFEFFI